jgi:5-methylcytosine-specific restriction endonuclease McrA
MAKTLSSFIAELGRLSQVKILIISHLWGGDELQFPKPWVRSSDLLALTRQKYFDRRIRELRDQLGCDIETQQVDGEHSYRLLSDKINFSNPRLYLSAKEKVKLFEKYNFKCQICGRYFLAGVRGLQADHKIPLIRGGTHELKNWHPICNACNVGKRGACAACKDDCNQCPWAFPENVGHVTLLRLPPNVLQALNAQLGYDQGDVERGVLQILKEHLGLH